MRRLTWFLPLLVVGCASFPNARLDLGVAAQHLEPAPVVCGPMGFRQSPLQARWGEYVRVTVSSTAALEGTAFVQANGVTGETRSWSTANGALVIESRFENLDPDARFALRREQPIDITVPSLRAVNGTCEGAVFTVEQGALVPSIEEHAWLAELERRGGPELAARRAQALAEADARRQAHYAAWEARGRVTLSAEALAEADRIRQAHYAQWEARRHPNEGEWSEFPEAVAVAGEVESEGYASNVHEMVGHQEFAAVGGASANAAIGGSVSGGAVGGSVRGGAVGGSMSGAVGGSVRGGSARGGVGGSSVAMGGSVSGGSVSGGSVSGGSVSGGSVSGGSVSGGSASGGSASGGSVSGGSVALSGASGASFGGGFGGAQGVAVAQHDSHAETGGCAEYVAPVMSGTASYVGLAQGHVTVGSPTSCRVANTVGVSTGVVSHGTIDVGVRTTVIASESVATGGTVISAPGEWNALPPSAEWEAPVVTAAVEVPAPPQSGAVMVTPVPTQQVQVVEEQEASVAADFVLPVLFNVMFQAAIGAPPPPPGPSQPPHPATPVRPQPRVIRAVPVTP